LILPRGQDRVTILDRVKGDAVSSRLDGAGPPVDDPGQAAIPRARMAASGSREPIAVPARRAAEVVVAGFVGVVSGQHASL
jgi:hypothetical protein